jgi:hypothetical protein
MSRDIETLLRDTARATPPSPSLATPTDLRSRGDRRRAVRRGGAVMVTLAVVVGIAVGVGGLSATSSIPPAHPGTRPAAPLPVFPVAPTLHHGTPAVARTEGKGPARIAANLQGMTTTYFTCVGGGTFKMTLERVPDVGNGATWSSGGCSGDVDAATVTYRADAADAVISIEVGPDAAWAIQVVPGGVVPQG